MQLVSFNLFRTLGIPDTTYIKPEDFDRCPQRYQALIEQADRVLFPEYWQLNALLFGMHARIFPSEASYRIGHDKIEMTRACKVVSPNHLPTTWIARNTPEEAARLWDELYPPFVAKLPKASQGEGVWLIEDAAGWRDYVARADRLYVQEYLPIDRDLRIVLVGDEVIAAYWRHRSDRSFHTNVARGGQVSYDDIPDAAIDYVKTLAAALGIDHAGFDIAMVGGRPYLIEFNRLFGNQGIPGGGKTITHAIVRHLLRQDSERPDDPNRPQPRGRHLDIAV